MPRLPHLRHLPRLPRLPLLPRSKPLLRLCAAPARRRLVLTVLLLTLALALLSHRLSRALLRSAPQLPPPTLARVSVWRPHRSCVGRFRTQPAAHSHAGFPYAVLRDAVVDRRPAASALLAHHDPPGAVRIVLYVTMHLSARLTKENARAVVAGPSVDATVEWAYHVTQFLVPNLKHGYKPGMRNKFGKFVTEWQVGLRLQPRDPAMVGSVTEAARHNQLMNLTLPVVRYDGVEIPWHLQMSLGCVLGWTVPGIEDRRESCGKDAANATGALLISGTALYGAKRRDRAHFREIANFAARALMGPVRYDAVAMGVVTEYSRSDMEYKCRVGDTECWERLHDWNSDMIASVAATVEEELEIIGVPRELFSRVLLIPSCNLGSDAAKTEWRDPCKQSKRYGQYFASFYSYAMLSPFFKWAASYDMDEFLASSGPHSPVQPGPAHPILDEADKSFGSARGDLVFQWLNFRVKTPADSRILSASLIRGLPTRLRNQEDASKPELCYEQTRDDTAKSAVRCDVGLGFTIHHPVMPSPGRGMEMRQGNRVYRGLRTWHARLGELKWAHVADCDYDPNAAQG